MSSSRLPTLRNIFLSRRPIDATTTTPFWKADVSPTKKGRFNDFPRTSPFAQLLATKKCFRHLSHILNTSPIIMHQQVSCSVMQLLSHTAQLEGWRFWQLRDTRVQIIWHCLKLNNVSFGTGWSSNCSMINEVIYFAAICWDHSAPRQAWLYISG